MSLHESISDKPGINAQIEKALQTHPEAEQTRIIDALSALQLAGPAGLSPKEWADKVRDLHPHADFSMSDLLKNTVREFPCCVKRIGEKLYAWDDADRGIDNVAPEVRDAISSQIRLSKVALEIIDKLGEFTVDDVATKLNQRTGMPMEHAVNYAQHIIDQFTGNKISNLGNGRYRVNVEPKNTVDRQIDDLKRLAGLPGMD